MGGSSGRGRMGGGGREVDVGMGELEGMEGNAL